MEKYSKTCRFIFSCNYSSKIIDPIQSRCALFRFRPLSSEDIKEFLKKIAVNENLDIEDSALDALIYIARGDMRRAVNTLQIASTVEGTITPDVIAKVSGTANEEDIASILTLALEGKFIDASNKLDRVMIEYGLSGQDIIRQLHAQIFKLPIDTAAKVTLVDRTGEIEFRIIEGSNEKIQLEALLAYFVLVGSKH